MKRGAGAVNWVLRRFFQVLLKIDVQEFDKIPRHGPLIMVGNHVNAIEPPVLIPHAYPREVIGLAKQESWQNPLFHFLFDLWEIIPIDRDAVDREAFRRAIDVLALGKILAVFPEGTRSKEGQMLQGKPGIVALALRSQAPLLPVALYGHENFWDNLKHARRTPFHMKIGQPFRIKCSSDASSRDARQIVTDEIMMKIAQLLPMQYRGYYDMADTAEFKYIE
jgi:1-acyl-sn-glycerol-3-phosphate acyltransferase